MISAIYWTLLLSFPHLIARPVSSSPGAALLRLPLTTDLALHASPLVTLLIDFFAFESKFSETHVRRVAPAVIVAFAVWYALFVEYCSTFNDGCEFFVVSHSPTRM